MFPLLVVFQTKTLIKVNFPADHYTLLISPLQNDKSLKGGLLAKYLLIC